MTRPPRIWNTWMMLPVGPVFTPMASRSPTRVDDIVCCRSRSWPRVRTASRRWAACSKRSASAASRMSRSSRSMSSVLRPSISSRVRSTATWYRSAVQIVSTHGATQRPIWYSRQGRSRFPVISSLQERSPNRRCARLMDRRARLAGRNGPA